MEKQAQFTTADILQASMDAEPATLKQGFHQLMLDKVRDAIEGKRDQVMASIYNGEDDEPEDDVDDVDLDDDTDVADEDDEDEADDSDADEAEDEDDEEDGEVKESLRKLGQKTRLLKKTADKAEKALKDGGDFPTAHHRLDAVRRAGTTQPQKIKYLGGKKE